MNDKRKIEFLPYELDLINKLGLVARTLDNGFKAREAILISAINAPLPAGYTEGTTTYRLTKKLVPETALAEPNTIVLTESLAQKFFETKDDLAISNRGSLRNLRIVPDQRGSQGSRRDRKVLRAEIESARLLLNDDANYSTN